VDPQRARDDLARIEEIVARTRQQIDPHAFHFVHWGLIVLVWFPLGNLLQLRGGGTPLVMLNAGAVLLGMAITIVREHQLRKHPRLAGENTFLTRQVVWIVYSIVAATMVLSAVAPATELIRGENVPILWGLAYAVIAFMTGVIYERDFLFSGAFIFAGCVLAILLQEWNGFILGPFMGLGMLVPGLRAERRVRRLLEGRSMSGSHA
jgi:hypothetical protein